MARTASPDIKSKHRAMWALGDYPRVADVVIPELGRRLVQACSLGPGLRVLDVAAGSGNAAIPAAETGADVVASDLTPELLEVGRRIATGRGVELTWQQGDAEALPYPYADFDVVISCVGVMFAPFHQAAADELLRVTRPGGTIGLINWTPTGFIGRMFAAMKPYAPPPPPGAQPPPLWGEENHVRELLGDQVTDLEFRREHAVVDRFANGDEFRDFFKTNYGPTVAVYRSLADQPERTARLDRELTDLAHTHDLGNGRMEWEYLLVIAHRA
ncbi:class I SAM-dependent methyltransferase [Nocardia paucivorans]|uniref:class I SAM-dependent methyltransferase n=1 Tax=Nocardia paucivorans TaxID=114259 RepID=UPI0002FEF417|nr:class I SAM-dependent methyltransferase [Nocardia paucivorans]